MLSVTDSRCEVVRPALGLSGLFGQVDGPVRLLDAGIQLAQLSGDVVGLSADGRHDSLDDVSGLKVPIAYIHGEHNRMFLPESTEETYDLLPTPADGTRIVCGALVRY